MLTVHPSPGRRFLHELRASPREWLAKRGCNLEYRFVAAAQTCAADVVQEGKDSENTTQLILLGRKPALVIQIGDTCRFSLPHLLQATKILKWPLNRWQ